MDSEANPKQEAIKTLASALELANSFGNMWGGFESAVESMEKAYKILSGKYWEHGDEIALASRQGRP